MVREGLGPELRGTVATEDGERQARARPAEEVVRLHPRAGRGVAERHLFGRFGRQLDPGVASVGATGGKGVYPSFKLMV